MIVVDSSALLAILEGESDPTKYAEALADCDAPLLSAATLIEAGIVMVNRHGPRAAAKLFSLIEESGIEVQDVTSRQARPAIEAFTRYGKGRHRAGLNYGDCISYALAKSTGLPLLYKGNDFAQTDLVAAVQSSR